MTWLKICGTTNLRDAQLSIAAGADALGFIFAPSLRRIEISVAADIVAAIRGQAETIGVFVAETPERVAEIAQQANLSGVQLHGDEPPDEVLRFRKILRDRKIIKTLHATALLQNPRKLNEYLSSRDSIDAILLDSGSAQHRGGTGTTFDWPEAVALAAEVRQTMPLIIAGGLHADNVARAIELFNPWGVDVVSGVESRLGVKDETKVRAFAAAVRQTEASARPRE